MRVKVHFMTNDDYYKIKKKKKINIFFKIVITYQGPSLIRRIFRLLRACIFYQEIQQP